jgi:hypothetical protein
MGCGSWRIPCLSTSRPRIPSRHLRGPSQEPGYCEDVLRCGPRDALGIVICGGKSQHSTASAASGRVASDGKRPDIDEREDQGRSISPWNPGFAPLSAKHVCVMLPTPMCWRTGMAMWIAGNLGQARVARGLCSRSLAPLGARTRDSWASLLRATNEKGGFGKRTLQPGRRVARLGTSPSMVPIPAIHALPIAKQLA